MVNQQISSTQNLSLSDSFNSDIVIAGKTRATKSVDEKKEFEIPPGCQLVILGSRGMEQLIFPGFNGKLKEYFGSGDTIEKFSALISGANILQHFTITSVPSVSGEYFPFLLKTQTQLKIFSFSFFKFSQPTSPAVVAPSPPTGEFVCLFVSLQFFIFFFTSFFPS